MLSSGPSETLLENRHFLRSNSIRSLQIENEKGPDRHPIFVNQMYNLVKPLAHPAGFEPTACRLGGGRSILLSYGCMPYFSRLPAFGLFALANIFGSLFAGCPHWIGQLPEPYRTWLCKFGGFSSRLTIFILPPLAVDHQYLRRRPLYPTELQVLIFQGFDGFRPSAVSPM